MEMAITHFATDSFPTIADSNLSIPGTLKTRVSQMDRLRTCETAPITAPMGLLPMGLLPMVRLPMGLLAMVLLPMVLLLTR